MKVAFYPPAARNFHPVFSTPGAKIINWKGVFQVFPSVARPFRSIWEKIRGVVGKGVEKSGRALQFYGKTFGDNDRKT